MATSKKNTEKSKAKKQEPVADKASRIRQIRLGFGLFFLLTGVFISFSLISYCFTWQADQDKLLTGGDLSSFLFRDDAMVANWGGRAGAVVSHILMYEWVGLASFAISIWITMVGLSLVYGKRIISITRYLRWTSLLVLVVAPVLTYLIPDAAFSYGGAWGNEAITYMNGFFGYAGTGLILFAIVCFFLFVVFALDISPVLKRARSTAQKVAGAAAALVPVKPGKDAATVDNTEDEEEAPHSANYAADNIQPLSNIEEEEEEDEWELQLVDKTPQAPTVNEMYAAQTGTEETAVVEEEEEDTEYDNAGYSNEPEPAAKAAPLGENSGDTEFSFEVTKLEEERSIPTHGGHISIADNEKYAPELDLPDYKFPTLDLLEERSSETIVLDKGELEQNKNQIINTLRSFGIEIQRISATVGPTVT
ncbi:MAG TPA: DNA translocase FtsK 4TM domain-containing protein, partial [Flavipsychrobacter sp.]